ncbi:type VI secretion system-associated protein TagF [Sphingobium sp. sgz301303]
MPSHGDFVSRGLARRYRTAWDIWCSNGLNRAQEALNDAFEPRHDIAADCCFWFGPGSFGRGWRMGAMSPARDRVRRPFMLVLGVETDERPCAHVARAYPEEVKNVIRQALAEGRSADDFAGLVPRVPDCLADHVLPDTAVCGCFWTVKGDVVTCSIASSVPPEGLIPIMMNIKESIDVTGPAI